MSSIGVPMKMMLSLRILYPTSLLVWLMAGCQPGNTYVDPPPPEVTVVMLPGTSMMSGVVP